MKSVLLSLILSISFLAHGKISFKNHGHIHVPKADVPKKINDEIQKVLKSFKLQKDGEAQIEKYELEGTVEGRKTFVVISPYDGMIQYRQRYKLDELSSSLKYAFLRGKESYINGLKGSKKKFVEPKLEYIEEQHRFIEVQRKIYQKHGGIRYHYTKEKIVEVWFHFIEDGGLGHDLIFSKDGESLGSESDLN